ncbi:tyrosine-type recombinase/integrase [Streptomyces sp. DSM 41524]|uniref:Tyrosine-type recombinase/integrase n=1 Tax=Streptomyces asiaticus subsp. ignotus TaxID=3098222 RepID=A0ABU7Q319_9ACTN|nr:tyrosine-type recombinase/integrase [Streptomyces sp. DSM 41524]
MSDLIKKVVLANGRVRYRFVTDGPRRVNGRRQQITRTFDTKKEARDELARIRHQTKTGEFVSPEKITVAEWLDTWLKVATVDVEKNTVRSYTYAIQPVKDLFGEKPLQKLTEEDIDEVVAWMVKTGRSGRGVGVYSVELALSRLRSALNEAVRRKLVVRNVAQFSRVPRQLRKEQQKRKAARKPWTEEEVRSFLRGIRNDRFYAVMLLSLLGLRPAEVCGLKWSAVDLEAGVLRIELTRTLVGTEVEEKETKTTAGQRTLPLPTPVIAALASFHARQAAEKLAAGGAYEDGGYVLVDKWGRPCTSERLRYHAYRLMREVGVRKVRPYDARHSALTFLATQGVPDTVLAAWAGHTNAAFTKRVYVTVDPQHLRVAATAFDRLLG